MLKIAVIKVESVELVSGATSDHVVPTNTWVTVKNTNATPEYVILQAVINPAIDESALPANFISWTGGEAVDGHPLQRRVSKQTAAHMAVIASCGSSSATGDVWIVWASVEIKMSGTTPANAAQFGEYYDATEILGVRDYQYEGGGNAAAGKVIPTGMLTPSGVYNVVSNGWDIKREMIRHDYKDGAVWQSRWIEVWTDDPPNDESVKKLHPDNADQIYDLDAPNIAKFQGSQGIVANSCERYDNFRQLVTWNKNKCSDYSLWYWFARGKDDTNSDFQVELKDVGVGNPAFPTNVPYYSPP